MYVPLFERGERRGEEKRENGKMVYDATRFHRRQRGKKKKKKKKKKRNVK